MAKTPIPQINVPIMKENGSMELAWYLYLSRLTAGGVGNVISVNGKEGEVVLDAEDVGALPDSTVIPTVNNGTLTVQKNGTAIGTFSANQNENATINVVVPTKTSDLTNDSGFITGISYQMVISALGYTPYDSTNPNGYQANVIEVIKVNGTAVTITNKTVDITVPTKVSDLTNDSGFITGITSAMVTNALGYTPYNSTNPNGYQANIIETVKVNGVALTVTSKAVDVPVPTKVSDLTNDSGFITGITYNMVTAALGYTPYNATNPNGYQANVIETIKVNGTALTPTDKAVDIVIPDVSIDNSTITRNGSNQLQANAVVNQNSGIVKTWKGTLAQYNALGTHATDTVYIITDDGSDGVIVPGLIMPYAGTTVPPGYLLCDGSAISRTTYANLFAAIGTTYGAGDGNTTFNLPIIQGNTNVNIIPGGTYNDLSWGSNHTAPANGWFVVQLRSMTTSAFIGLTNLTNGMTRYLWGSVNAANYSVFIPVRKGDVIQGSTTNTQWASDSFYRFYYAQNYNNSETKSLIKY